MKNVKILLIFILTSALLLASSQRVSSLGGNVGYWADDDNSWTAFPHTINNANLAQVSGIGSDGNHNAIVRWGEGTKWGFSWNQANANDMINLQWGNGSMGVTFGLNTSAEDDGDDTNGKATSGMGISASWGMEMGFGELGAGFTTSSYDDGSADTKNDPSTMGVSVNLRRAQSLWIFDNMLVGFAYNSFNSNQEDGMWIAGVADAVTTMDLKTSLYTHVDISENTRGLIAMGFGYKSHINGSYGGATPSTCDGTESNDEVSCAAEAVLGLGDGVWVAEADDAWSYQKDAASSWVSLPTWTFAVESAMTDWATARVGVNAGYNLVSSEETTGVASAKATTGRGGMDTAFSVGLGINYASFNLDVDVSEGLFTNPVQHVTGYESIAPNNAKATLTYSW